MVDKAIEEHIAHYDVNINKKAKDSDYAPDSVFVEIEDINRDLPPVVLHFIKGEIYSVTFLNNQFFDIPEEKLWVVLDRLLAGDYRVVSSIFRKKRSIKVVDLATKQVIGPERVYDSPEFKDEYNKLPKPFSRK